MLLGGGPIDPALRARAAAAGVSVVATYGSAETAGGCVYDGVALDGVALATEADGRLRVSGPMLFDRYDGDPALTGEVLVDGWFRTADAARIDEDGRLQVLGRVDDMVITGGVNVPAPAVARRLRAHPAVTEAEVLGVPDEEWGTRLVAFVVGDLALEDARAWVAEQHPRSWAPRQLVRLDGAADAGQRQGGPASAGERGRFEVKLAGRDRDHDGVVGGDHDRAARRAGWRWPRGPAGCCRRPGARWARRGS